MRSQTSTGKPSFGLAVRSGAVTDTGALSKSGAFGRTTLRANLITLAAETGEHPLVHLYEAALGRDLSTPDDIAAVLNWRLPQPTPTHGQPPLPWLAEIPQAINDHPVEGDVLGQVGVVQ